MAPRGSKCCVLGCSNRKRRKSSERTDSKYENDIIDDETLQKLRCPRTFHSDKFKCHRSNFSVIVEVRALRRFPLDRQRRLEWICAIERSNWTPSRHSMICSDHFLEKFMNRTGVNVQLREHAIPTRFKNGIRNLDEVRLRARQLLRNPVLINRLVSERGPSANDLSSSSPRLSAQESVERSDHVYVESKAPEPVLESRPSPTLDHDYVQREDALDQTLYDEYTIFGMHVANELRSVKSDYAYRLAKLRINQILFDACTGALDTPDISGCCSCQSEG